MTLHGGRFEPLGRQHGVFQHVDIHRLLRVLHLSQHRLEQLGAAQLQNELGGLPHRLVAKLGGQGGRGFAQIPQVLADLFNLAGMTA